MQEKLKVLWKFIGSRKILSFPATQILQLVLQLDSVVWGEGGNPRLLATNMSEPCLSLSISVHTGRCQMSYFTKKKKKKNWFWRIGPTSNFQQALKLCNVPPQGAAETNFIWLDHDLRTVQGLQSFILSYLFCHFGITVIFPTRAEHIHQIILK